MTKNNCLGNFSKTDWINFSLLAGFFILLTGLSRNFPFFWDNVLLSSIVGHFFYENGFSNFILPFEINCGHPPFFGAYVGAAWKTFGYNLAVAHFAMIPFLLILAYHLIKIFKFFLAESFVIFGLLLLILEPSLISQCTMVSNDVVMTSMFIWALSSILYKKEAWLIPATIIMVLINIRGALMVFMLFPVLLVVKWQLEKKLAWKQVLWFFPSLMVFALWNAFHYSETGSMLMGNNPKWAEHYEYFSLKIALKNLIVIARNMLDYGRVFLWFGIVIFASIQFKSKELCNTKQTLAASIFLVPFVLIALIFGTASNPVGHRYLLVFYVLAILLFSVLLQRYWDDKFSKLLLIFACIGTFTGNLWVYPETIAQGWDSTLGHINYFEIRREAYNFVKTEQIPKNQIGAGFTMQQQTKFIDLQPGYGDFGRKDKGIDNYNYILYSNIINDFSDDEIDQLNKNWILKKQWRKNGVFIKLFANK